MRFPTTTGGAAGSSLSPQAQTEVNKVAKEGKEETKAVGSEDFKEAIKEADKKEKAAEKQAEEMASLETTPKPEACLTSPCNIWWVPKGSGCPENKPCSQEVGCDFLTGKKRPKPLYDWQGFSERADLMGWDPACYSDK